MELKVADIERVMNQTLPGLTLYVRDVNLPEKLAGRYEKGMIIREPGFCDASSRVGGMVTSHRYAILSNHMADLSAFEHGTGWALHVASSESRFKVLATQRIRNAVVIVLLHLPDGEGWRVFQCTYSNLEDTLAAQALGRLESKLNSDPIDELAGCEWLERCKSPLGMDSSGSIFAVE